MSLAIVLYQPEIPPNTGNVIRLCANVGARLHLIRPLGFDLSEARLRRAGLDYAELTEVCVHEDWAACLAALGERRLFALSTRGTVRHDRPSYLPDDAFVFGPETRGLPDEIIISVAAERRLRLPMRPGNRSINLSNTVAVVAFEAWRQMDFAGGG
ncbi:MAG TPA: tRNA (cytidine(34)-2'-O)-methyltransferase [Rhodocyclaceae bacterium]|nr:tRNA (cytidine(34)-2'-O)-methyltransferase [Rhodocyclaceae bacterium]